MKASERIKSILAASGLLALTGFFFIPAQIQLTNAHELPYTLRDVLSPLFLACLFVFLMVGGVLWAVPGRIGKRLTTFALTVGLLLYLQANWILWDYGTLDGRDIDWSSMTFRGGVDGAIWIGVIVLGLVFGSKLRRLFNWLAIIAIAIQVVNLTSLVMSVPGCLAPSKDVASRADLFAFSEQQNVLVILLDTLQSDFLQQAFDENPEDRDVFDGFTFYRNSLAGYPTTKVNVPLILTGKYFQNDEQADLFAQELSAAKETLPRILKDNGYRSHLIGTRGLFIGDENNSDIYIDYLRNTEGVNLNRELLFLADMSAFRSLPHFAKKRVYNDQKWFLLKRFGQDGFEGMPPVENLHDLVFARDFVQDAQVDEGPPVFKYMHFWGAHPPVRLNEDLEYVELPHSRANFVTYTRAGVSVLRKLFDRMKELGIYDNTLIVVTGDHGAGFHQYRMDPRAGGIAQDLVEDTTVPSLTKSSAMAAILVKEIGVEGPLKYDDRPVTLGDLPATVAGSLGLDHAMPGVDFINNPPEPDRDRFFYFYIGFNTNADHFFEGFTEYRVKGHSWLDKSWTRADSIYAPGERKGGDYELGERITFLPGGNYTEFAPYGFSVVGLAFTWTDRNQAGINMRLGDVSGDLVCRLGIGMVWGNNQIIEVWINGEEQVADWYYKKASSTAEEREFTIPMALLSDRDLTIEFRLPNANISPKDAGLSEDGRRLGLGLAWIEISEQ